MRRLLVAVAGLGIAGLLPFGPDDLVLTDGPTASIGDWHLTVLDVSTDTSAGAPYPVPADGIFYVIAVNVVGAGAWEAELVDATGRVWPRALDVEVTLPSGARRLVFDVDDAAVAPVLRLQRPGHGTVVEMALTHGV